jgi:hypothetical protein
MSKRVSACALLPILLAAIPSYALNIPLQQNTPASEPQEAGLYYNLEEKAVFIEPLTPELRSSSGLGSLRGIKGKLNTRARAVLPGKHSKVVISETKPTFYLKLSKDQNIRDFALVRLEERGDDRVIDLREVDEVLKRQGGANRNLTVPVQFERTTEFYYKIIPKGELPEGEYGLFHRPEGISTESGPTQPGKVYDFSIKKK